MNKQILQRMIVERLTADLEVAQRAAQTAYETATHEENVAENKYDTLGLEASYLATGQARRMEEIRQALVLYRKLPVRTYDPALGIVTGTLVALEAEDGQCQWVYLGPDGAGLKLELDHQSVTVITPHSPLGQSLMGKVVGDEVYAGVVGAYRYFVVVAAS